MKGVYETARSLRNEAPKKVRMVTSKGRLLTKEGWPAPLYNLYFDSFLLICTSFVVRTRGIVCVVYLLFRLANYKDPCKRRRNVYLSKTCQ